MAEQKLPYDGYVRVSRKNGRSGASFLSPELQRQTIERLAKFHNVEIGEIVEEIDVKGSVPIEKRELGRLVQKVKDGKSGGLLVWKISRASRKLLDGITAVMEIKDAGGRVIGDDGTSDSKALIGFLLGRAEEELDERRTMWKAVGDSAVARGVLIGITPVGFDRLPDSTLRRNADEATVRQCFLARPLPTSWDKLAQMLDAAGVEPATYRHARESIDEARTKAALPGADENDKALVTRLEATLAKGPVWSINSVRSLIGNPIYKGELSNGHKHHFAQYAIVTPSEWEAAQPKKGVKPGSRKRGEWALLSGLVFCAGCRSRMRPTRTTKGDQTYSYYKCGNRTCRSRKSNATVQADKLEQLVLNAAANYFEGAVDSGLVGHGHNSDHERVAELEIEIGQLQERRRALGRVFDLNDAKDAAELETLSAEIERLKSQLTDELNASRVVMTPEEFRQALTDSTLEERRALVAKCIERITVYRQGTEPDWSTEHNPLTQPVAEGSTEHLLDPDAPVEDRPQTLADRLAVTYRTLVF